jgi:hypothetical protein
MVKTPNFKLLANDKDVTDLLQKELISITFKDEANEQADELTIKVAAQFARPQYEDELKLYLGYGTDLAYCGLFVVQTTTRESNNTLSISATGVNFSNVLKEKRDITYEKISIKDICSQIANRNVLKLKSDFDDVNILSIAQSSESDLHFLNRLAIDYNAIFNIKNGTLIFTHKIKENKKNEDLPAYTLSADEVASISIRHSNKTLYKSCKSIWHDTKENITKEIIVGVGEPVLINKGNFKNAAEAKLKAQAKLERAVQGLVTGNLSTAGKIIFAGGILNIEDTLEDDGEYQIKSVDHNFSANGWQINLEFER